MLTTVLSEKARECDLRLTRKFFLNKTAQYISLDWSFTYAICSPDQKQTSWATVRHIWIFMSEKAIVQLTWDQALFSFRFENYIPAGKERMYENR